MNQPIQQSPLVSVIVPVYNAGRYLAACVASVRAQSFVDWELILVDDGSTDESGALCDAFAAEEPQVRVLHQENAGVSAARNAGLDAARGVYIAFLDADDVLSTESLAARVALMEDADLCITRIGMYLTDDAADPLPETAERGQVTEVSPESPWTELNRREAVLAIVCSGELRYQGYPVNKLFRADIIRQFGLRFATDLAYNEDRVFCTSYALHANRVTLGNNVGYWYRQNEVSAMGSLTAMTDLRKERYLSEFVAYRRMADLVQDEFPEFVAYIAGDAMYRAAALKQQAPKSAPQLRKALTKEIRRNGGVVLSAPLSQFSLQAKAKVLAHVVLGR